ncbi:hypothetical protein MRB53_027469 [Persea americana]|uniref:Uncharacterized protein n=1 Tax=Persea americana TaxID=3435 RepID=A0ACC2LL71_PERAE|nr:hypothetical protein MRB53_027469 [Persea americana]
MQTTQSHISFLEFVGLLIQHSVGYLCIEDELISCDKLMNIIVRLNHTTSGLFHYPSLLHQLPHLCSAISPMASGVYYIKTLDRYSTLAPIQLDEVQFLLLV